LLQNLAAMGQKNLMTGTGEVTTRGDPDRETHGI
jgi:hypothetical protein